MVEHIEEGMDWMNTSRICAIDVGNDSVKAIFGKYDYELNIPNVIATRCSRPSSYRNRRFKRK